MRIAAVTILALVALAGQAHADEPTFDTPDFSAESAAPAALYGSSLSLTSARRAMPQGLEQSPSPRTSEAWADCSLACDSTSRLELTGCCSTACNTITAPRKQWHFVVGAYLWAADISGTSYADGESSDIDVEFSDLFEKLDYSYMGYVEARYKRWSFAVDASTLALKDQRSGPLQVGQADAELTQTILDLRLGYAVYCRTTGSDRWGRCCYPRHLTLDAIVGARHWSVETDIQVGVAGAPAFQVSNDQEWWDPYVGARFRWQFAKRWGLLVYGDVGGFDIEDASEFTWQIQALLKFSITRNFFVGLGYRTLSVDRVTGSGATKNGVDATYSGPILGLGYIF